MEHPALGLLQRIRGEKLTEEPGGPVLQVVHADTRVCGLEVGVSLCGSVRM